MSKNPNFCGIYMFEATYPNEDYGKKYIGLSIRGYNRKSKHYSDLENDNHHAGKLQDYYNKYGKEYLNFSFLMECPENELAFWEKWWIASFDSFRNGFNSNKGGSGVIGSGVIKTSVLKNFRTGEVITCKSRAEFGRKYNLSAGLISDVINGISQYVGDWYCPETNKWEPKIYNIVSPDDKEYAILNIDIADFCKEHGLNSPNFWEMLRGKRKYHLGWCLLENKNKLSKKNLIRQFQLISPNGVLYKGENIKKFAKENGLDARPINRLVNGKSYSYKGWRRYEEGMDIMPFNPKQHKKEFIERIVKKNPITKLVNPEGFLVEVQNISGLCKENNLQNSAICLVLKGKLNHHKGWRKYNSESDLKPFKFQIYKFISPDGKIYETKNQHELARQFGLLNQGFCDLWQDRLKTYKGWTKYKEETR